jgi:S1-C subfamily serine protease
MMLTFDFVMVPSLLPTLNAAAPPSHMSLWQKTIEKAVQAIVSIRFSQVSAFDTEGPDTSEASGFVVDAERGLILTNRHGEYIYL